MVCGIAPGWQVMDLHRGPVLLGNPALDGWNSIIIDLRHMSEAFFNVPVLVEAGLEAEANSNRRVVCFHLKMGEVACDGRHCAVLCLIGIGIG